jgi:hypothetical protein
LDPVYHALGLALQLVAEIVYVAVHHLLINFEAPVGRIEVEEAPAYFALGQTLVNCQGFVLCDSDAASLVIVQLLIISVSVSRHLSNSTKLTLTPMISVKCVTHAHAFAQVS